MTTLQGQMDIFDLGLENIPVIEVTKRTVKKVKAKIHQYTIFDELERFEQIEKREELKNVVYPSIEDQLADLKRELYELSKQSGFSWYNHGLPHSNYFSLKYHRTQPYGMTDYDRSLYARKDKVVSEFLWDLGVEHYRQNPKNLGHKQSASFLGKEVRNNGVLDEIVRQVQSFNTEKEVHDFFGKYLIFDGIESDGQPDIYRLIPHKYEAICLAQTNDEKEIKDLLLYSGKSFGGFLHNQKKPFFFVNGETIETAYYQKLTTKHLKSIHENFLRLGRLHNDAEKYELEYQTFIQKYNDAKGEIVL